MYSLSQIKQKVKSSDLLRYNLIFFVGTMFISVFNYLYYPVLSRMVTVADFGEIQAVISIFMQLGIVLTAFGYVITNIVSNTQNSKESNRIILHLEQIMFIVSIIALPLLIAGAFLFQEQFKLHSVFPIFLVGLLIILNIPATSRSYILQGERELKEVSVAGVIYAAGKLLVSVGLIYVLTNDIVAAVLGYIIAQVATLIYLQVKLHGKYVPLQQTLNVTHVRSVDNEQRKLVRKEMVYGLMILLVMSGLTLIYSSDTILARLFFDPYTLGLYSGVSSVARIIFFVTASVAGVLIASVKLRSRAIDNKKILLRSAVIIFAVGGFVALVFCLAPKLFIGILVGPDYVARAAWLPLLSIVMLLCSLNNLLAIYQIALRKYLAIIPVAIGVVVLAIGLFLYHSTVEQFIWVLLVSNLSVFMLLSIEIAIEKKDKRESSETDLIGRITEL